MLVNETYKDVPTQADGHGRMRRKLRDFVQRMVTKIIQASSFSTPLSPTIPKHDFPESSSSARYIRVWTGKSFNRIKDKSIDAAPIVTGPIQRFARQIAGHGYIVAAPSSYHEFTGPEPLAYDVAGTDAGNDWKIKKV
jgi:hypothetical protein